VSRTDHEPANTIGARLASSKGWFGAGGGNLRDMLRDRFEHCGAQRADFGLDAAEQRPVGLGAAAQRLLERMVERAVQAAQSFG
jgi:hypothetical protein